MAACGLTRHRPDADPGSMATRGDRPVRHPARLEAKRLEASENLAEIFCGEDDGVYNGSLTAYSLHCSSIRPLLPVFQDWSGGRSRFGHAAV